MKNIKAIARRSYQAFRTRSRTGKKLFSQKRWIKPLLGSSMDSNNCGIRSSLEGRSKSWVNIKSGVLRYHLTWHAQEKPDGDSELWVAPRYSLKGPQGERAWDTRAGGPPHSSRFLELADIALGLKKPALKKPKKQSPHDTVKKEPYSTKWSEPAKGAVPVAIVLCTGVDPALMETRRLILEQAGHLCSGGFSNSFTLFTKCAIG